MLESVLGECSPRPTMRTVSMGKLACATGQRLMREPSDTQAAIASEGNTPYHLPELKHILAGEIVAKAATLFYWA